MKKRDAVGVALFLVFRDKIEGMQKKFFIIMGRSGSGKGTQAQLLKEILEKEGYENILHITTGGGFRKLSESGSLTAHISKELTLSGGLNPEFLAIWNWTNIFIDNLSGNETVILDGAPRRIDEISPLHSAIHFYGYEHPTIINIDVSETWAKEKLLARGREDDKGVDEVERKMKWYEEDVIPCLDHYAHNPLYKYLHINGEQTIEEVHKEILAKLEGVK